jgi:DNA-binding FrmR family transcriptional regulator
MDVEAVIARLKRIEGQVRGIIGMIGKDVPCEDILIQIGAAKSALHKTGQVILEGHIHHCVLSGIEDGDAENTLKKLVNSIEHFARLG